MTILYTDGGCSDNNQLDQSKRRMVAVVTAEDGSVLTEAKQTGGSNNIAELMAVREALAWCQMHKVTAVEVRTDSRNNLSWVNGSKLGKKLNDRATVLTLLADIAQLRRQVVLTLVWIPREQNKAGHYIEGVYGL